MSRKWIVGVALLVVLAVPVAAWAHGGHAHKVMGTVSSVQGNHVQVKTTDGKIVMVMLDQKTAITRGKAKLDATALKIGERVSVDYMQEKDMNMAKAVKLGTASAAATK
jgi:hypothetical protein